MAFNYFYKQFETIRVMIRQLYLYGCYNRSDYKSIVSGRKFDNELKRAKMVLNPNNIVQSFKGKTKYTSIVHDYFSENQNVLADTYLAKAFNKNEFILYFYIMQSLRYEPMSLVEVEDLLSQYIPDVDRATIRNHLDKMCLEGYLVATPYKNRKLYSLANDIFEDFSKEEIEEIMDAVSFYMNTANLQTPGFYCYQTLIERSGVEHHNPFIFQHNFLHQILDEEILQDIYDAISGRKSVSFDYNNNHKENITPVKVKTDYCFGRKYLIGFDIEKSRISIFRVDKITNITEGTLYADISENLIKYCWCVSWKPFHQEVTIIFQFDTTTDGYLIRRLYRDKKHGTVSEETDGKFTFTIDVCDSIEMVPWLRTFYGHIISTNCEQLNLYLKDDVERMVSNYEDI